MSDNFTPHCYSLLRYIMELFGQSKGNPCKMLHVTLHMSSIPSSGFFFGGGVGGSCGVLNVVSQYRSKSCRLLGSDLQQVLKNIS